MPGRKNIAWGFLSLGGFMLLGFMLVYLRDFGAGLAHVHGNLFALINIVVGYLLMKLPIPARQANAISWLTLGGMLMPIGILVEVLFDGAAALVLLGGLAMVVATLWMSWAVFRLRAEVLGR